jgi:hypothetical protein
MIDRSEGSARFMLNPSSSRESETAYTTTWPRKPRAFPYYTTTADIICTRANLDAAWMCLSCATCTT